MKILNIKSIKDLHEYLNSFQWACCYYNNDKWHINNNPPEQIWWKYYKTLTPKQFLKLHAGCCWDYTNFEYFYFKDNFNYPIKCYYFESEYDSNHTWLCYIYNGYNIFESSWKNYIGIHNYKSEIKMLNDYSKKLLKNNEKFKIYEYIPSKNQLSCIDFMQYIHCTGKLIKNK